MYTPHHVAHTIAPKIMAQKAMAKLWSLRACSMLSMAFCVLFLGTVTTHAARESVVNKDIAPSELLQRGEQLQSSNQDIWHEIDRGLDMATFDLSHTPRGENVAKPNLNTKKAALVVMRIDPTFWAFSVHCASNNTKTSLPIRQWAEKEHLTLAINASMYLPDGMTSTGYLQDHDHVNNPRIGSKLGAFFVADAISDELPPVAILDKTAHAYESLIPNYHVVVQNFRLISPDRHIVWNAGGARHSIAAIGQDNEGRILFIHCAKPMTPHELAATLLALPLHIRNAMYVEGGPESALLLRTPDTTKVWIGKLRPEILGFGNRNVPLPNIIGVRPRK